MSKQIISAINTLEGLRAAPQLEAMWGDFYVAIEALRFISNMHVKPGVSAEEKAEVLEGLAFMNVDHCGGAV